MRLSFLVDAGVGLDGVVLVGVHAFRSVAFFGGFLILRFEFYAGGGPNDVRDFVLTNCDYDLHLVFDNRFACVLTWANRDVIRLDSAGVF